MIFFFSLFLDLVLLHIGFDTLDNHIIGMVTIHVSTITITTSYV